MLKQIYYDLNQLYYSLSHEKINWVKRIVVDSEISREYSALQANKSIERKFLPKWHKDQTEIILFDDTLLQISLGEHPSILEIKHQEYFIAQKSIFDYMRDAL